MDSNTGRCRTGSDGSLHSEKLLRIWIVMVCRNTDSGGAALEEIERATGNKDLDTFVADLSSQQAIRQLVEGVNGLYFEVMKQRESSKRSYDRTTNEKLWALCEGIVR